MPSYNRLTNEHSEGPARSLFSVARASQPPKSDSIRMNKSDQVRIEITELLPGAAFTKKEMSHFHDHWPHLDLNAKLFQKYYYC